jgi:uroporphyrinogen-III synthase
MGGGEKANPAEITGCRILRALVTRPREEALSLAAELAGRGIDAVIEPMMEVHYSSAAVADLANVQAVRTSAMACGLWPNCPGARSPALAVGDATACVLVQGFTNVASAGGDLTDRPPGRTRPPSRRAAVARCRGGRRG